MTIVIPSISELQSRIANDLVLSINAGQLDTSKHIDPTIRNSFAKGIVDAMSGGFDENNDVLNQLLVQIFPQTATGIYLERWASWFGITRKSAVKASGYVVFSGTDLTSIPAATPIQRADGVGYTTNVIATIAAQTLGITSITRVGSTATVTTVSNHNLASGNLVSITGAAQSEYNITNQAITVTGLNTYTFTVSGSPATPATGTIISSFTTAYVQVTASDFGSSGNSSSGSSLTLISPIVGVNDTQFVAYEGLVGGLDIETDDSLRARLLERCSNFSAPFTEGGLPVFIKEMVAGVTRIWVKTATPSAGYVTIYFARDEDGIIPTGQQVTDVKNAIIDPVAGIKPANTPDAYVIVAAPTALTQNFVFSSLSPNTLDMRNAITESLTDFFKSTAVAVGQTVSLTQMNNVIYSTVDSSGNNPTFTLTTPSADLVPTASELPILGTITF